MPIINKSQNWFNRRRGLSLFDKVSLELLESKDLITDSSQVEANDLQTSFAHINNKLKDSPNNVLVSMSKQKSTAQIEDSSHLSRVLIIGLLVLCIGILSIAKFFLRNENK